MKRWLTFLCIAMLVLVISACSGNDDDSSKDESSKNADKTIENKEDNDAKKNEAKEDEITVTLNDIDGNEVAEATLTEVDKGVKIKLTGDGLPKEKAKHAFHVHEKGVCEPEDFESAGGHYNPADKKHGKDNVDGSHAGDFDNIEVGPEGEIVDVEFTTDQISLDKEAENTVFTEDGTSLVIHDGPDDYKSQPAGDAGDRIACGVIAEPK